MSEATTFEEFDPGQYQTITRLTALGLASLARALITVAPPEPKAQVKRELLLVGTELEAFERALAGRHRGASQRLLAEEVAFDQFVDGLWISFDARLRAWSAYTRPGIAPLLNDEASTVDYAERARQAKRSLELVAKVFGAEGLSFTRNKFEDQATAMATLLQVISEDELGDELDKLAGAGLLEALYDCQERYEAMVTARSAREQGLLVNLRELMAGLRMKIQMYVIAVISTLDRDEPESLERVQDALRPIISFRERARARAASAGSSEDEDELELDAQADLEAEAQAQADAQPEPEVVVPADAE
ncbi:hypothetical protein ENSA5_53940 [Enhygromyxa salina]|uniref:Uncharacterized protein n=1 Tax=Enhygromyxa salina TaxID=215803 RepID=A0A2S9XFJ2_9BACT|nr:hypothetical protein [Enhygromyxa salina]PRP91634.1 hypothetical protein ENSA5_53940 [Enhygromyxa salina]